MTKFAFPGFRRRRIGGRENKFSRRVRGRTFGLLTKTDSTRRKPRVHEQMIFGDLRSGLPKAKKMVAAAPMTWAQSMSQKGTCHLLAQSESRTPCKQAAEATSLHSRTTDRGKGKDQEKIPWVDSACADCPGFLVRGVAGAPTPRFVWAPALAFSSFPIGLLLGDAAHSSPLSPVQKRDAQHKFLRTEQLSEGPKRGWPIEGVGAKRAFLNTMCLETPYPINSDKFKSGNCCNSDNR